MFHFAIILINKKYIYTKKKSTRHGMTTKKATFLSINSDLSCITHTQNAYEQKKIFASKKHFKQTHLLYKAQLNGSHSVVIDKHLCPDASLPSDKMSNE